MPKQNMRILICTDPGNAHSEKLLNYLGKKEKVGLYWLGETPTSGLEKIPHYPIIIREPINVRGFWRLSQELPILSSLLVFRPDIIHVHVDAKLIPKFKFWAPNKPVIFTCWGHIPLALRQGEFGKYISLADGYTADSAALLNELQEIPESTNNPQEIFRFGVDFNIFCPAPPSTELKAEFDLPPDSKIVYSPRSLRAVYNHETLIKVIPLILVQVPNAYFLFVNHHGHRYPDAENHQQKLKMELEKLGVMGHVRFLEHISEHDQVSRLYQLADVTVSIPLEDGFPATILESMACGTPLVVSDLPDYEGVVNNQNAICVPAKDTQKLSEAVITLLTNQELWLQQRQAGLVTVKLKGDLNKEIDKLISFYSSFLRKNNPEVSP